MGLKSRSILFLAVIAGCGFFLYPSYQVYIEGEEPEQLSGYLHLGLDLQGGMYLDTDVDYDAAIKRILDRTEQEVEYGLIDDGVQYLDIGNDGSSIIVELAPGSKVDWNIGEMGRILSIFTVDEIDPTQYKIYLSDTELERIRNNALDQALEVIRNRVDSLGVSEPSIQKNQSDSIIVQLPGLKDRESALAAIGTQATLEFFLVVDNVTPQTMDPDRHIVKYQDVRDELTNTEIVETIPYVLERRAVLSGETVSDAIVSISSYDGAPYVGISFNAVGARKFADITSRNRGRQLAIVLDDKVQSAPVIRDAIASGEAQISGQFTLEQAGNLAVVLRSGALPAPLMIREERTVGASLGEDSIRKGVMSLLVGSLLIVVFMIIYYRLPGFFASLALIFNLLLILVALAVLGATLTLPGLAGIVLTMGIAIDANVIIFERIREELAAGAQEARTAIDKGFKRATWTILDANVTTLFAAMALLTFGTGPIKGFAVTLSVGIIASLFTAIIFSRYLFDLFYPNRRRLSRFKI